MRAICAMSRSLKVVIFPTVGNLSPATERGFFVLGTDETLTMIL